MKRHTLIVLLLIIQVMTITSVSPVSLFVGDNYMLNQSGNTYSTYQLNFPSSINKTILLITVTTSLPTSIGIYISDNLNNPNS